MTKKIVAALLVSALLVCVCLIATDCNKEESKDIYVRVSLSEYSLDGQEKEKLLQEWLFTPDSKLQTFELEYTEGKYYTIQLSEYNFSGDVNNVKGWKFPYDQGYGLYSDPCLITCRLYKCFPDIVGIDSFDSTHVINQRGEYWCEIIPIDAENYGLNPIVYGVHLFVK